MGVCAIGALGCTKGFQDRYGPFYIMSDSTVYSKGDMGSRIDKQFDRMMDDYPGIQSITLRGCCPGSRNDEKLYIAARKLRSYGIAAILTNASMIEFCAVDLFIAVFKREIVPGAQIGVHSWFIGSQDASDFELRHEEHEMYLDLYCEMFEDLDLGVEFYWFTVEAASPNNIHYTTNDEIDYFQIDTE